MKKAVYLGMFAALAAATVLAAASWGWEQATGDVQAVSWDNWRTAKAKAEEYDNAGKYAEALQYYLEYTRQADGLARPELVAWGKNNAAYMIIKMHKQDPTIDLAPAKKLLEEGQAIDAATDDCKQVLATNMEYVKLFLRRPTP
jgi:hypothetical protein